MARAAYDAGAKLMFGYPITPVTEVFATWVRLINNSQRLGLQTEDEIAAGFGVCGAVLAGERAFTATGGPGMILMQDPLSMAEAMRLPMVVFDGQRGGPSTGQVIYSQQEVNLAIYGGNGEGLRLVYSTSTLGELYDYGKKVFEVAWQYRFPTILLYDGYQGKMKGEVEIQQTTDNRQQTTLKLEPILTGNMRNTYNLEEELGEVVQNSKADFDKAAPKLVEYETKETEDAQIIILAHGIVASAAKKAVEKLREKGLKVGLLRPITLSPFPEEAVSRAIERVRQVIVFESSLGQFSRLVKAHEYGLEVPIVEIQKPGVGFTPEEIEQKVKSYLGK